MAIYRKRGFRIVGDAPSTMGNDVQNDHVTVRDFAIALTLARPADHLQFPTIRA